MTFEELSEQVAHYCDENQLESEEFFLTTLNGVLAELLERFPEVSRRTVTVKTGDSQTTVNMREATEDFASFSDPSLRVNGEFLPIGHPLVDARLGEVIIPRGFEGEIDIYYNKKAPRLNFSDLERNIELPLPDEKAELAVLLTAYRLLVIDEDKKASWVKGLYDEAAYRLESRATGVSAGFRSVDGWA